eukprot:TRINITY_DN2501_c0_g1_i15.p2 TRINITY_DN2501_c0_g1~~TRINITY_DN2501_c0_g1_i15.p2  ORF type:complete len:110 (-),score=10.08 TRINITY_DN2501_c0_g1_i15:520-849(-)
MSKVNGLLRFYSGLCGVGFIVVGVLSIIDMDFSIERFVIRVYMIPLGILVIISAMQWKFMLRSFGFLRGTFGRGVFYFFVGGVAFGLNKVLGYIAGGAMMACSIFRTYS